ncbi:MAG: AAA family ATPase [Phycisphaerae bacterium]
MSNQDHFERLIRARHPCVLIPTLEELEALQVVRIAAVAFNRPLWIWSAADGVIEGLLADAPRVPGTESAEAAFTWMLTRDRRPVCVLLDAAAHLRNDKTLRAWRNLVHRMTLLEGTLVMIEHSAEVPPLVKAYATTMELTLPDEAELESLIRSTLRVMNEDRPVQIDIKRSELSTIVRNLRGLTARQARRIIEDVVAEDRRFDESDINAVLAAKRRMLSGTGLLEYVESPTTLEQIGGLSRLKSWLAKRAEQPGRPPREFGLPSPRGVLMLGVQGAGKSLSAKAIATAWQRPLLRMDVGALYDRYVGESERRLRETLAQAEAMAPIVLWIDEIEKAFASSSSRSTDGGLSQRMFGTLLTWMQEHTAGVFLVATANDIEALPPELLRKGRFDEIFFVDLPGADVRREILAIHLRKRGRDPAQFDLKQLATVSDGFSGAEIEQAIVSALHEAYAASRELDTHRLAAAIAGSPPLSVTMAERIAALRAWAAGRCVPAD